MWFDTCLSLKSISPASVLFKMKTKILENLCIWLFVCADTNVCEIWATESIYIYIEIYLLYDLRSMFLFPSIFFFVFLLILHWPGNDVSHSVFSKNRPLWKVCKIFVITDEYCNSKTSKLFVMECTVCDNFSKKK